LRGFQSFLVDAPLQLARQEGCPSHPASARWETRTCSGNPLEIGGFFQTVTALSGNVEAQAHLFDVTRSHISDFAFTFDRSGRFLYANQPLLDLWGLTLEEAIGKNFLDFHYPDELATGLQRQIQHVIDSAIFAAEQTRRRPQPGW
jgi:PAS domain-containing protein